MPDTRETSETAHAAAGRILRETTTNQELFAALQTVQAERGLDFCTAVSDAMLAIMG